MEPSQEHWQAVSRTAPICKSGNGGPAKCRKWRDTALPMDPGAQLKSCSGWPKRVLAGGFLTTLATPLSIRIRPYTSPTWTIVLAWALDAGPPTSLPNFQSCLASPTSHMPMTLDQRGCWAALLPYSILSSNWGWQQVLRCRDTSLSPWFQRIWEPPHPGSAPEDGHRQGVTAGAHLSFSKQLSIF